MKHAFSKLGSIMFHVRRRPADCAPRKRKKKPGALQGTARGDVRIGDAPILVELGPDGSAPHPGDANKTIRLVNDVMEVGSANGIALQLYGPHIQPRHCVITNSDGVTSLTPCNADAHTYVNGQRIHQTTILTHGSLVKFGNSNTYRFLDPAQEDRTRHPAGTLENSGRIYERMSGLDRFPRGQDPILPAVLEFPEEPQEQFLARVITHLDVTTPTFRLAPAYTLYLCARYRASTHYRPELTPTERAHKLTLLLQHAAMLIRHTVQDRSTESTSQAFWLANASELLHFLKSDRHVSAFSLQAQDTLADSVQAAFKNLAACLTDELNSAMTYLMSVTGDDHPREVINILSGAMNLLRKCRVNAALTIQLFSQLFHWISAKALSNVISNANLCTRNFGNKLSNRLRNLHAWAESQGLELAAECHLAKIVQCSHLLQANKQTPEDLANLSAACFKLNSMQLGALLMQYKAEPGEKLAPPQLLEQAAKAAESVADELARAEGRDVTLYEDPAPPLQLLLPDDGFSCDVVQGVPPGLADFLHPLQASGLCRLALQPTSSGHWTVYMSAPRSPSALSTTQPEVQVIRLHKAGGGMGLSIVAAKGAGQERLGIYIKSVVPGGAADRDGRLAAGDQLLSVDGQSLLGITQEKAAEFLVRTGTVVTLEVAKGGAVYHGLATLLQQPSPTPHRGPRRMSERDLPSCVDSERSIPSSKSVPALHQIHSPTEPPRTALVSNDGYSRTSSNNSINNNSSVASGILATSNQNGPIANSAALRSRSTHNLNQQDGGGFYQNLSIYRNKPPSPQQPLGDRTSILRSSQNSLQSSVANSQRPSSAYYAPSVNPAAAVNRPTNLHQSIPNLKSPPSIQRLHNLEDGRGGGYPMANNQPYGYQNQGQNQPYPTRPGQKNQNYPSTEEPNDSNNRSQQLQFPNNSPYGTQNSSYPSPTHSSTPTYPNSVQHPLSVNANGQDRADPRGYNGGQGGGLLREDVFRQSQAQRHDDLMRYPSSNNIQNRTQEDLHRPLEMRNSKSDDTIRHHHPGEMMRYASSGNIRVQDAGKMDLQPLRPNTDHLHPHQQHRLSNEERILRGQAKLAEMGDEVRRRQQNRLLGPQQTLPHNYYQQQQQYYNQHLAQSMQNLSLNPAAYQQNAAYQNQAQNYSPGGYSHHSPNHQSGMGNHQPTMNNHQSGISNHQSGMTNHQHLANQQNYYQSQNSPSSPQKGYSTTPKMVGRKMEDAPEPPPTSTHPLYSASSQDPPKMAFYPSGGVGGSKPPIRDPWAREEQERQQEARRQAAREWQEQQIRELSSLPYRSAQQEEQLRALQLEREFQRRALETEIDQDDEDTEKESPPPRMPQPVSSQTVITSVPSTTVTSKHEPLQVPPTSILKPGGPNIGNGGSMNSGQIHTATSHRLEPSHPPPPQPSHNHHHHPHHPPPPQTSPPAEPVAPPPPERGSSFQVMSIRAAKEPAKRVSFDTGSQPTTPQTSQPPSSLPIAEEKVREDPNNFIRQAESMLASPTSPNEASPLGVGQATPGVIGAQEFYRDPRTRRLQEQQQKSENMTTPVPEKLSFKEKMKMFAMETGEQETPKDKSKISRAQREIDSLGGAPQANSGLVH